MLRVGRTIISLEVLQVKFSCNLFQCRGACCVEGDSGAPLEEVEMEKVEKNYRKILPWLNPRSAEIVENHGRFYEDSDGDIVTPLRDGNECVYCIFENGTAFCAFEKAWLKGFSSFRKPLSCHLYPIRIKKYDDFDAVNFNDWSICSSALIKGNEDGILLVEFLKEALIRKYGKKWYKEVLTAAFELNKTHFNG